MYGMLMPEYCIFARRYLYLSRKASPLRNQEGAHARIPYLSEVLGFPLDVKEPDGIASYTTISLKTGVARLSACV